METIQSQEKEKEFEIEKILCLIKDSNFDINDVKQKLKMDLDIKITLSFAKCALIKIGNELRKKLSPYRKNMAFQRLSERKEEDL